MGGLLGNGVAPAAPGGMYANVNWVDVAQRAGVKLPADTNSAAWRSTMNQIIRLANNGMSPDQAAQTVARNGNASTDRY
jgi:hypothetical protein